MGRTHRLSYLSLVAVVWGGSMVRAGEPVAVPAGQERTHHRCGRRDGQEQAQRAHPAAAVSDPHRQQDTEFRLVKQVRDHDHQAEHELSPP